jgi:hypothetical protein
MPQAVFPSTLIIRPLTDEQHKKTRRLKGVKWWDKTLALAAGISVKTLLRAHPETRMRIVAAVLPYVCGPEVLEGVEIPARWLPEPTPRI